jgi:hypothetical protein
MPETQNVPGRKTDVNDAQWLQKLHSFGLLRASFRPEHDISVLRSYLRQRERLTEYRAAHIQHMQKALMQMNVQLHHAVSDITGVTGLSIVRAIISGERDPSMLIQYRDVRCKKTPEVLRQALTGNWQPEHLFALEQSVAFFDFYQERSANVMIKSKPHYCSSVPELKSRKGYCPPPDIVQNNPISFPLMSDHYSGKLQGQI